MVRISRVNKQLIPLATPTLVAANILERSDLQEYIFNSPDAFCKELGQQLKIIAKEVLTDGVDDRIDLLAIDEDGDLVIIELKRGSEKLQLLQAIAYVGMAAKWTPERIRQEASRFDRRTWLDDFEDENLNRQQRILLLAEAYDYEVLVAAEWLYKKHVELDCVRVALAVDGDSEYLTFTQIFPTPELAAQARKRGNREPIAPPVYASWADALATVTNDGVADFFKQHLDAGQENNLRNRRLDFRVAGQRRFSLYLKKDFATAHQRGRFPGDTSLWPKILSSPEIGIVSGGTRVRFRLATGKDFVAFEQVLAGELQTVDWGSAESTEDAATT
jgi:hypothetical protein